MPAITDLADRYWDTFLDANPSYATLIGNHDRDGVLEDVSQEARASDARKMAGLLEELASADSTADPVTAALLANVIEADLTEYETEILALTVDPYLGVHSGLIQAAAHSSAPSPESARLIGQRYAQIPRLFSQMIDQHRRMFSEGKTPTAVCVHRVMDQLDAYLDTRLDTDPFVGLSLPPDWSGAAAWRENMEELVSGQVRPAFADYREFLSAEAVKVARP